MGAFVRPLRPNSELWQHRDFLKLWGGESISELGSQVSQLAIPWTAAIILRVGPLEFAALGLFGFIPFVLFALPAGVWVDRMRRRPILIAGDVLRAVLLASIPIAYAFDALTIWHLLAVQFLAGVCTVFFDIAYRSYLPALVRRDQLVEGNAKLQLSASVAQVAGPSATGAVIAVLSAPFAIAADAVSYVFSALIIGRIRAREEDPVRGERHERRAMWPELVEGLRWVLGHRLLSPIAACTALSNLFGSAAGSILVLYLARTLRMSAFTVGVVLGLGALGAVGAALSARALQEAIGIGRTITLAAIAFSCAPILLPVAPHAFPVPVLVAGVFILQFGGVIYNIAQVSLRQAVTPDRLQGRMNAAMRWIVWGVIPIGTMLGGVLAAAIGLHAALWIAALASAPTFLPIALSGIPRLSRLPSADIADVETPDQRASLGAP